MMKKTAAVLLGLTVAVTATGCAKRQIDPETTGSVAVEGTGGDHALQKFCDGNILIYWTPGRSGEEDEYEFIVYDSPLCTDDGDAQTEPGTGPQAQPIPDAEDD